MTEQDADQLVQALELELGGTARYDRTSPDRCHFEVTTPAFTGTPMRARQVRVWKVVDDLFDRETSSGITLIMTYAPEDLDTEQRLQELEASLAH